jgi:ammonia channel protein AmtB
MTRFEKIYNIIISMLGVALIWFGWDAENAVPLLQAALIVGGAYIGHTLTKALDDE